MSAFAFVLLMMLLARSQSGSGSSSSSLATQAAHAQVDANAAKATAARTGDPVHHAHARQAQQKADVLKHAATQTAAAKTAPAPWPQATPSGLPPFPGGWEPDQPPPQAVQARAWQLLPVLWKQGAGARKTEKTQGRWITYQAQQMGKKKGVVAFRVSPGFMPPPATPPAPEPSANA